MSWLDLLMIVIFGALVFFSFRRGIIVEFFDLLCIIGAFCIGSFAKGPIAGLFVKQFEWSPGMAEWVGFLLVAVPVLVIIFLIGSYVNDNFKIKMQPDFVAYGGGFFGIIKSFIIIWMIMMLIASIPGVLPETRLNQGSGFFVKIVDSFSPTMESAIKVFTPGDTGKKLAADIEKVRFPKTKEQAEKQYQRYIKESKFEDNRKVKNRGRKAI